MRIIGGTAGGRRIAGPGRGGRSRNAIRPTSERAREAICNLLSRELPGSRVLDLFAGIGAMGLEALSRGAESALLVDNSPDALRLIIRNIEICSFQNKAVCKRADLTRSLSFLEELRPGGGFDLVFMDPPYRLDIAPLTLERLSRSSILAEEAVVVAEVRNKKKLPEKAGNLLLYDRRNYGEAGFWLYTAEKQ